MIECQTEQTIKFMNEAAKPTAVGQPVFTLGPTTTTAAASGVPDPFQVKEFDPWNSWHATSAPTTCFTMPGMAAAAPSFNMPGVAVPGVAPTITPSVSSGFDRVAADCYKMIRETRIKVDVPDHKGVPLYATRTWSGIAKYGIA